jgi:hypothetical protein
MEGIGWAFVDIVLPALFLVVLAYVVIRNRNRSRANRALEEEGARRLQRDEEERRGETRD